MSRRPRTAGGKSHWTSVLREQLRRRGIVPPQLVEELRYHETRQFRLDFAIPTLQIAMEVEGGVFVKPQQGLKMVGGKLKQYSRGSRHTMGAGFQEDCVKYNEAAIRGWLVLRFTSNMITRGLAVEHVLEAMKYRGAVVEQPPAEGPRQRYDVFAVDDIPPRRRGDQ